MKQGLKVASLTLAGLVLLLAFVGGCSSPGRPGIILIDDRLSLGSIVIHREARVLAIGEQEYVTRLC